MSTLYPDESALVNACLKGTQDAWDELVGRYGRLVFSIAQRYRLTTLDAEDTFQNVFIIVSKQLSTLRNPAALLSWIAQITHHECQRLLGHNRHDTELTEMAPDHDPEPVERALFRERQMMVLEAMTQLDPRSRQLLTLLFLESDNPSYAEIAMRLKIPVGSIGPSRERSLKKLEAVLKSRGYDGDPL